MKSSSSRIGVSGQGGKFVITGAVATAVLAAVIALFCIPVSVRSRNLSEPLQLSVDECIVRHEANPPDNPIVAVTTAPPGVVERNVFLVQPKKGMLHMLIRGRRPGETSVTIHRRDGSAQVLQIQVQLPNEADDSSATLSRKQVIEMARERMAVGKRLTTDIANDPAQCFRAHSAYAEAVGLLKKIELYSFLPEFNEAQAGLAAVDARWSQLYEQMENGFKLAMNRSTFCRAKRLARLMLKMAPDRRDSRHMVNQTYMTYCFADVKDEEKCED